MFRKEKTQPATETSPIGQIAEISPEKQAARLLMAEAAAMEPHRLRRNKLARGESYNTTAKAAPFAEAPHYGGNTVVGLTQLVFVGESVLGITHHRNTKKAPQDSLEAITVSLLPIGKHANTDGAARVIEKVDVGALSRPNSRGYIEPWKTIAVGRGRLAQLNGGTVDPSVSANHLEITIDAHGGVGFRDDSSNGTQVLEPYDFDEVHTGLSSAGRGALVEVAKTLREHPETWDPEIGRHASGAQVRVINPDPRF